MVRCWAEWPGDRPSFAALRRGLEELGRADAPYVLFTPNPTLALPPNTQPCPAKA